MYNSLLKKLGQLHLEYCSLDSANDLLMVLVHLCFYPMCFLWTEIRCKVLMRFSYWFSCFAFWWEYTWRCVEHVWACQETCNISWSHVVMLRSISGFRWCPAWFFHFEVLPPPSTHLFVPSICYHCQIFLSASCSF